MEIFSDIIHGIKCDDDTLIEAKELYQKFLNKFEKQFINKDWSFV